MAVGPLALPHCSCPSQLIDFFTSLWCSNYHRWSSSMLTLRPPYLDLCFLFLYLGLSHLYHYYLLLEMLENSYFMAMTKNNMWHEHDCFNWDQSVCYNASLLNITIGIANTVHSCTMLILGPKMVYDHRHPGYHCHSGLLYFTSSGFYLGIPKYKCKTQPKIFVQYLLAKIYFCSSLGILWQEISWNQLSKAG